MNKVITINLNGNAYQLEESGYDALRGYLDTAAHRLDGNPDKGEIIADIEQAIADKFRAILGPYKNVVGTGEVAKIIAEMGPVQDASEDDAAETASAAGPGPGGSSARPGAFFDPGEPAPAPKRLYKISDGAMVGGVCNGLAAYFNIDVTIIRLVFAILFLVYGTGVLVYILLMVILPAARTPEEMASAHRAPSTAQEFIRRAKEGYYEGMKTFKDKQAHREWKRKFKQEMRGWKRDFQREMHEHTQRWGQQWNRAWAPRQGLSVGACIALPFLTLFTFVLGVVGFAAVICLLATGAVFGMVLPHGLPLWLAILLLIVAYRFLTWPVRVLRHACYHGGYHPPYAWIGFWEACAWIAFILVVLAIAHHHMPRIHEAVREIDPAIHRGIASFKAWWARQ